MDEIERGAHVSRTLRAQIAKMEMQLAEIASKEEFPYEVQLFFTLYADSKEELERTSSTLMQEMKNSDLTAHVFALRQDKAWKTVIPYGIDYVRDKQRNFNTGAVVSSIPFYIPELHDDDGVYLGPTSSVIRLPYSTSIARASETPTSISSVPVDPVSRPSLRRLRCARHFTGCVAPSLTQRVSTAF